MTLLLREVPELVKLTDGLAEASADFAKVELYSEREPDKAGA